MTSCPPPALNLDKKLNLNGYQGSYFQAMTEQNGIKASLDTDEVNPFSMANWSVVQQAATNFDLIVYQDVVSLFIGGEIGLQQLVSSLATSGQKYTPDTLASAIATTMQSLNLVNEVDEIGLSAVKCMPFLALASGAGTLVQVDDNNYCYHVGYKPGSANPNELSKDVKSGRSFGASPGHNALDASDLVYLDELGNYLNPNQTADPSNFYRTIFQSLTQCNSSGWKGLSSQGQELATDFLAIYTAELDRNLMANLRAHSWEDDLAEVTLLSAYGVQAGMAYKNGQLIQGTPKDYFGIGPSGSGIGETRNDRHTLQSKVCQIEESLHSQTYKTLANLIGGAPQNSDLIHQLMVFLNDPAQQTTVNANADQIIETSVQFLQDIRSDANQITTSLTTAN